MFDDWRHRRTTRWSLPRIVGTIAAGVIVAGLALGWALAQEVVRPDLPGRSWIDPYMLWKAFEPLILYIVGAILSWLAYWAASRFNANSKRDTYNSAARTAAGFLVQMLGPQVARLRPVDIDNETLAAAIRMVQNRAPSALEYFGITERKIQKAGTPAPSTPLRNGVSLSPGAAIGASIAGAAVRQVIAEQILSKVPELVGPVLEVEQARAPDPRSVPARPVSHGPSPEQRNPSPNR